MKTSRLLLAVALLPALALAAPSNGVPLMVKNGGTTLGPVVSLNCGTGMTCTKTGSQVDITATRGLPADPAACAAGRYVIDQDASGVLLCAQVAYSDISGTPAAYALPDAASLVTGGVRLTGDFGGTATSPTVPGLAGKVGTARSISTTAPLTGGGDLSADRTLAVSDATTGAKGVVQLAGQLGGTAASPTVTGLTGAIVGVANHTATGTPSAATYYRGDNTWADLTIAPATTPPAAPASGLLPFAYSPVTTAAPAFPGFVDAGSGANFSTFPFMGAGHGYWGCIVSGGFGNNGMTAVGAIQANNMGSSSGGVSFSSASLLGRTPQQKSTSTAAINSLAGYKGGFATSVWRGDAAGRGGFAFWSSWAVTTVAAGVRVQVGLVSSALGASAEPSASTNSVYFGCDSGSTNYSICSNDGAGSATCSTLGASFPCNNAAAFFNGYLWAAPNASSIGYAIERLDSPATASGTISADLPTASSSLLAQTGADTGTGSAAIAVAIPGMCYLANP